MGRVKKDKNETFQYWPELVETYFNFCKEKFEEKPSFDGSAPRDLKIICESLKKRAEGAGVEWTELVAIERFLKFLTFAYQDRWLKENFILSNLNRQKDKIFFNIRKDTPVIPKTENKYQNEVNKALANFKVIEE